MKNIEIVDGEEMEHLDELTWEEISKNKIFRNKAVLGAEQISSLLKICRNTTELELVLKTTSFGVLGRKRHPLVLACLKGETLRCKLVSTLCQHCKTTIQGANILDIEIYLGAIESEALIAKAKERESIPCPSCKAKLDDRLRLVWASSHLGSQT